MDNKNEIKTKTNEYPDLSWAAVHKPMRSPVSPFDPYGQDGFLRTIMPRTLHWSIPWSDLMMTMFILFAILFMYHVTNHDKDHTGQSEIQTDFINAVETSFSIPDHTNDVFNEIPKLFEMGQQTLKADNLKDMASVELIEDKAVRIILTSDVFFDAGKADLKPEAIASLYKVTGILKETPHVVNVVGHTDNVPINTDQFPSNWELSTARACVTARFLINEMEISPDHIFVSGHASYQPVRPNDTHDGRKANRRVEIIISKERPKGMVEVST